MRLTAPRCEDALPLAAGKGTVAVNARGRSMSWHGEPMSSVTVLYAVSIFSVFAAGLIAGQMLAIGIANYAVRGLPETSWTLRFQSENDLFTKTMPPFLLAPAIGLVTLCFLAHDDARWMFAAAAVLILIVLAITMAINVPINRQVNSWTAGAAPSTWMFTRDRWLRFHLVRTVVGLLSFAIAAIGVTSL
jgi:uncharacterized membrane protein